MHMYEYISEDVLTSLIRDRLKHEDCAAGVIFENLKYKLWPNELFALKCIMNTKAAIQLVLLTNQVDEYGYEICRQIEWPGMEKLAEDDRPKKEDTEP